MAYSLGAVKDMGVGVNIPVIYSKQQINIRHLESDYTNIE